MDADSAVMNAKDKEITEYSFRLDEMMTKEQQLEQELADVRALNAVLSENNKSLQEEVMQLRSQIDSFTEKIDVSSQEEEWKIRFEKSQQKNIISEQDIENLKESVRQLEEKLALDAEKTKIVREQLEHQRILTKEKNNECDAMMKQIEEMRIERSSLLNDVSTLRSELTAAYAQVMQAKSEAERIAIEKHQELAVLEDFRLNADHLMNEVRKKEIVIEDLQEQIKSMQLQSAEKDELVKAEKLRFEESISIMEKDFDYNWSEKFKSIQEELSKKHMLTKDYEHRLEEVTQCYQKVVKDEHNTKMENIALKEKLNELMLKHQNEVDGLIEQNRWDHEDLEKEMQQAHAQFFIT
ncbi:hypothetical protein DICVIV_02589 [Dictyocaulus viviparus]|uniref:Uncharacterized protein n=1 Tax=Dictyocaulus viviparus TaxID=29172 RepID=A0A0D8Y5H1_DICVI|nr:hypothetical protein DICVIV_02589 [Dictyocaulus viviparus]